MPSCSIRPKATPPPPGVHANCPDSAKFAASSIAAPATMVRLPCTSPAIAMRRRSRGRTIQPTQHSPNSTPSVALWVAAAKAVKANSRNFSIRRNPLAMQHQDEQRQHRQPGKDVGQQHAGEPGQRRGQDQGEAEPDQPQWPRHAEHAQGQLQDPEGRQRLNPEIEPEARILAVVQIETEHRGAAGDQIALVPAGQIAAGVPLQQRIAVPQRRGEQYQGNCDGGDPNPGRVGDARA